MSHKRYHVSIVGGGISGLAAAFYLQKKSQEKKLPVDFTLLEASHRLGGKIQTEHFDGFIMEKGPDSFLARKKSAARLVSELGMSDELVQNDTGQAYILHGGRLHPLPAGAVMGVPTQLKPFLKSKLVSPGGKLRAALDLIRPRGAMEGDQSIGQFFQHRLGREVVERMIEPLLSGIYSGDIDRLSLMATFPYFRELEKNYRSLILAMKKTRPPQKGQGKPQGQFLTLKNGLQSLVDAIENHLPPQSIRKNTALQQIKKLEDSYRLTLDDGTVVDSSAVILAVPGPVAQNVLQSPSFLRPLNQHTPTSVANVVLAYPESAVTIAQEGTGFVVPRTADATITACTWTHKKWPHTTPAGNVLLRCYVGRAGDDDIVNQPDETIVQAVLHDLRRILNIHGEPHFYRITRWKKAMPQYAVGHHAHLQNAREYLQRELPGVVLAGASYEGVGLPDCIDQGRKAVKRTLGHIFTNN